MSRRFDAMYAQEGRPSIPPERLLKAKVPVRSVLKEIQDRGSA